MWAATGELWYKRSAEMVEHRQARRVPVSFDVVLESNKAHYVAETWDVSETGLFLHTQGAFPVGTVLRMTIGQPPNLPRIDAVGVVRRVERGEGVGVQFITLRAVDQKCLTEFLDSFAPAEETPK